MKLRINKACDLSSISVLPPHSRRASALPAGTDASSLGKSQASQIRSQSQQSFSQGMSFSQLSQSSLEENLMNDHRFGSQERDNSTKRISSLAPITSTREESQMQLSRSSNNVLRRWNPPSAPDNRCQVSDELEHRFRVVETSINRLGMILDSVQNDVMQVNRAVKEVSLETEGIRQKMTIHESSMQRMLKGEEEIKSILDGNYKPDPDQKRKESDRNKLHEIAFALSALPERIEGRLLKLQHELCMVFSKEMEAIASSMKSINDNHRVPIQSPTKRSHIATRSQKIRIPTTKIQAASPMGHIRSAPALKNVAETSKALKPKLTDSKQIVALKQEEIPMTEQDFRLIIESDEEIDGGFSCLLVEKETGGVSYLIDEAKEETMRILRKARKRKRKHIVILD